MLEVRQIDRDGTPSIVVTDGVSTVFITEHDLAQKDCIRVHVDYPYPTGKLIHTIKDPIVLEEGKVYHSKDIIPKRKMLVKNMVTEKIYIYQTTDMNYRQSEDAWLNVVERFVHLQLPGAKYKILDLGD